MPQFDVAVVGAGIAGASLAYELSATHRVVLLEREPIGGTHSTGRSAALFISPYGGPTITRLAHASLPFLTNAPEGFTDTPLLTPRGILWVARADQLGRLEELRRTSFDVGKRFETLTIEGACARCPVLDPDYLTEGGAAFDPDVFDIDVHELHSAYLRGFRNRSGTFMNNAEVVGLERHGEQWFVEAGNQTLSAKHVVNAGGGWAGNVAALAGAATIHFTVTKRTMVVLQAGELNASSWPCVVDVDEDFYFKPDGSSLLVSPADESETSAADAQPDEYDIAVAIDRIEKATLLRPKAIAGKWAGLRTFAPDGNPVVGWDPVAPNFFWLAGQGGAGIMTSPAVSRLASSMIAGDGFPRELMDLGVSEACLSPSRLQPSIQHVP
ncbi:NAD(P)/FAD-dependent oxidoreductase [Sphingosinicella rhizophila]|uniref:FAD-binding oxidoreductase n=1 Tax=Sphingosinicella rhizophila TaxID=3050082 RepID=A0ABU3Q9Y5_9SPHN|nr:FAD-binding oxidoreductase [Sphingosinicella sp. GR2756]MDT9600209.1 FAD-binding oxidoreductase [Sphingosinicella sp. GR2756]